MINFALQNITQLLLTHSRKFAAAVSIALIILMSLTVANSVLIILEAANPPNANRERPQAKPSGSKILHKVSDLPLFGKTSESPRVQQAAEAPTTKLNLELQGVFIAEEPDRSTAIVGERSKTGELFEIGDRLPGNAILTAVFVDHILIRRGSRTEKLMFADTKYRIEKTASTGKTTTGHSSGMDQNTRSDLEAIRERIRNRAGPTLAPPPRVRNSDMAAYREKLKSDPATTLREAGISAVSNNESKGYRISEDVQSTIRQAGLQPGDVVLSVNGRPVGIAANDAGLIDQVMASSRVRVEVQRGTRRFFLTVPVPK